MVCGKCGAKVPDESAFCLACGARLAWEKDRRAIPGASTETQKDDSFERALKEMEAQKRNNRQEWLKRFAHHCINIFAYCAAVALLIGLVMLAKNIWWRVETDKLNAYEPTEAGEALVEEENLTFQLSECKSYYTVIGLSSSYKKDISIPFEVKGRPVCSIAEEAFKGSDVESVHIPNSITSIGKRAFAGAEHLWEVKLPDGLKIIEESTFDGCESLCKITMPKNLMVIKAMAFAICDSINTLTIPESIVWIDTNAFYACSSLRSLRFNGYALPWISDLNIQAQCDIEILNNSALQQSSSQTNAPNALKLEQLLINLPEVDSHLKDLLGAKLTDNLSHKIYAFTAALLKAKQMYLLNDDMAAYVETVRYLREEYGGPFVIASVHRALDEVSDENEGNSEMTLEIVGYSLSLTSVELEARTFEETEQAYKESTDKYVEGYVHCLLEMSGSID